VKQVQELMARSGEESGTAAPGPLAEAARKASDELIAAWGQKLAEVVVRLIEKPGLRLAGAEEAIRQSVACIEQVLTDQEAKQNELTARAAESLQRLHALLDNPGRNPLGGRRGPATPAEVVELLHGYARQRFDGLLTSQLIAAYLGLRGNLSDELREVNFCRVRLTELLQALGGGQPERGDKEGAASGAPEPPPPPAAGTGRALFPAGCKTLDEAVEYFLSAVTPEDLQDLETRVQAMIRHQFSALVHVCLGSAGLIKGLETAMMQEATAFVEGRITYTDVAEMFLAQYPDEQQALNEIANAFEEAVPEIAVAGKNARPEAARLCVLAVPSTPAGEEFRRLAHQALADVELVDAVSLDDIILYREWPHLPLAELDQCGRVGREAYAQMTTVEHFTPHTRTDITSWRGPATDAPVTSREQSPAAR
jgi:hypothetical protein